MPSANNNIIRMLKVKVHHYLVLYIAKILHTGVYELYSVCKGILVIFLFCAIVYMLLKFEVNNNKNICQLQKLFHPIKSNGNKE